MEVLKKYIPQELYIEQLPPWLVDRNYPNTQFVPPIVYLGFDIELPDEDRDNKITDILGSWGFINVHAGDELVKICCLDSNLHCRKARPYEPETVEKLAEVLNCRPRLYISMDRPCWEVREHYHAYSM